MSQLQLPPIRKKAVWGRTVRTLTALLVAAAFMWSSPAEAQNRGRNSGPKAQQKSNKPKKQRHLKLDSALNELADGIGETDVIIEFHEDRTDGSDRIRNAGGRAGKKMRRFKMQAGRIPNALLRRLADDSHVKRVHLDREVVGEMARTNATIGAQSARHYYGYTGAGVGVAVIDSGITAWHDDLTSNYSTKTGQRVTAFVDFVNGQTSKYDDWGHGTHVAGIIAGNGYDSLKSREGVAPKASIVALKALDSEGKGRISNIIAALDWVVANQVQYNIRVVNMSLGAGVFESYWTDPLTLAAKRAVDAGIVVVAAAGNMGKAANGQPQYGAISAPGNAPWVLTVGAYSTNGTNIRRDDTMALYSSRGPTMIDFAAKPDLVAPGTGTVSLSVTDSVLALTKPGFLMSGTRYGLPSLARPYLALTGTSMATPVVAGTVALMLEANPNLTPNMVKAILQFTAEDMKRKGYNYLTQGAGFLNTLGAVRLSRFFAQGQKGSAYPDMRSWSRHILWGNRRVSGGVLTPGGTAWALNIVWGDSLTPAGQNIVWGENCDTSYCDNIVWGNNIVWGDTDLDDNIVWGYDCGGADCDNIVWGNSDDDNIVWGNAEGLDNIVWGNTDLLDNIVWGNSAGDEDVSWGSSAEDEATDFGDDTTEYESFNPELFDDLFEVEPLVTPPPSDPPSEGGVQ